MSTALNDQTALVPAVEYPVAEQEIAEAGRKYAALSAATPDGYEAVIKAIAHMRTTRTSIEKRRVALKSNALEYGRRVDTAAKKLTELIEQIEEPLKAKRDAVDHAKEIARRAAEDAERIAREEAARAAREAEEKRIADERAKLAAEQAAFEDRRRAADAERATKDAAEKAERDRVAAEQRAAQATIDAQRAELERQAREVREREEAAALAEAARVAKETAEREAAEKAERDRIAVEEARAAEVARAAAERARLDALRPDVEKLAAYAADLRAVPVPEVASVEARETVAWLGRQLAKFEAALERVAPRGNA